MHLYKFSSSAWGFGAVLQYKYKQVKPAVNEVLHEQVCAMLLERKQDILVHVHVHPVGTCHRCPEEEFAAILGLAALLSSF